MDTRFVQAHKEARWGAGADPFVFGGMVSSRLLYLALPPVLPAFRAGLRWPAS
ncbi:Uncharacterised protein [Escherichia coli]|uniref:Uncharacterized protein n=1 Tax=Escherichia coli TaxID=562 RepID=A0A376VEM9_ECOLX|nr:Uncharacterised protein [Escherichia coli]